mgnify:CR=1 FL=1
MKFKMTQAQLDKILEACRPVPMIALQCGRPSSQQENANNAWAALGAEMGFDPMTVRPCEGGDRFFTADLITKAKSAIGPEEGGAGGEP